jgi:protein-S-isoprenylcysteine O-methyltransferase Ste14
VNEILLFSFQLALGILVPWLILRRDFARLAPPALDRAWNPASFWMAIVMFGPLCLPFHFVKTRRSLLGLLMGLGWMLAAFVAIGLVASALEALLGD